MKLAWKIFWLWTAFVFAGLLLRFISMELKKRDAVHILSKRTGLSKAYFDVEAYHYLRGDYRVSLSAPPFKEISWTANLLTGQVIPWRTEKKESPVLRSFL